MKAILTFLYKLQKIYWRFRKPLTLGSRIIVIRDGAVLLVRLTYHPGWFLPGGGVDKGETFGDAAQRELEEECGIRAKGIKLQNIYLSKLQGKVDHIAVFVATDFDGEFKTSSIQEIAEIKFFKRTELPPNIAPGHLRRIEESLGERAIESIW